MTNNILASVKKNLGLPEDYTAFDADVIMHINSVFNILHQLGVGPDQGFQITGNAELWTAFTEDNVMLNLVKSYTYLRVRLLFDPPATSFHLEAIKEQIREFEWRINVKREETEWSPGTTVVL